MKSSVSTSHMPVCNGFRIIRSLEASFVSPSYLCKNAMNICFNQYFNTSTKIFNTNGTNTSILINTNTTNTSIPSMPMPPILQYHQYQCRQYFNTNDTSTTNTSILIKAFNTNSRESWYCDMPIENSIIYVSSKCRKDKY